MTNFRNIQDELENETSTVNVEVITLGGVETHEIEEGMTVADFKQAYGFNGMKLVDNDGDVMNNNDVIENDMQLFVSAPKKNG